MSRENGNGNKGLAFRKSLSARMTALETRFSALTEATRALTKSVQELSGLTSTVLDEVHGAENEFRELHREMESWMAYLSDQNIDHEQRIRALEQRSPPNPNPTRQP